MNNKQTVDVKMKVDTQELEDAGDLIAEVGERLNSTVPNITIRNNENVYVTIYNMNQTADEHFGGSDDKMD